MQNHDNYSDQGFICPSFNSYSSPCAADTAARVCREVKALGLVDEDTEYEYDDHDDVDDDDDFEFVSFQKSGDNIFLGGDTNLIVGPVFPVFNRDLISQRDENDAVSSTSSDVDELEGVPAGSYCVWMPKSTPTSSPSHCKKSKSTGSTTTSSNSLCRKFRLSDLLRRSNSEGGKDAFVLLTPALTSSTSAQKKLITSGNSNNNDDDHENRGHEKMAVTTTKGKSVNGRRRSSNGRSAVSMAHEVFYAKSKENYKRQSYLPYRKDLVGFFASVNAMGRTFPSF